MAPPTFHRLADSAGFASDSPSADPILSNDAKVAPPTMHRLADSAGSARDNRQACIQTNADAKVAPPTFHRLADSAWFAPNSPSVDPILSNDAKVAPPTMHRLADSAGSARDSPSADPTHPDTHRDTEDTHRDTEDTDGKDFASKLVSQCYKSINDRFPSISSNSQHTASHRAPQCARAGPSCHPSSTQADTQPRPQRPLRTSKHGSTQRNKVSSYFNCNNDVHVDVTTPVGCTIPFTNNSIPLGTSAVSDTDNPDRLSRGTGANLDDHSPDPLSRGTGANLDDHSPDPLSGTFRHDRLPSDLLDIDTQDHTTDTTDNNPLDISVKILNTDHHSQPPSTLQILESLDEDESDLAVEVSDHTLVIDRSGADTRNLETRDPGGDLAATTSVETRIQLPLDLGESRGRGASGVASNTPVPNKVTRKRARDTSRSPDTVHKKIIDEKGTVRKRVADIPDNERSRFFKIKYVPRKIDHVDSTNPPPFSVPRQADEKKTLLSVMTPTQRDEWHKGRNAQLLSDKAASRYSWVDQALENQMNTHWAYGTIGLPVWLTTNERTLNSIIQIRSNAAREIMEVAREHLRRETASYQAEADRILDAVNEDLQPTQAKISRRLVDQHATRHMTAFTEDLSERREWLINHQPTMIETISMRPEGTRPTPAGKIPTELLSEDGSVDPTKSSGLDSKESHPTVGRKRKTRPKKRSRLAAQARSKVEPPAPKTTPPSDKGTGQRLSDPKRPSTSAQDPPTSRPRATSRDNVAPRPRDHRGPRETGNQGRDHPRRSPPSR